MSRVGWVLLGDRVVAAGRVSLLPWDDVVRWGAGVFETIGCQDGAPFLLEEHRRRMAGAVAGLGWGEVEPPGRAAVVRLLWRAKLEDGPAAVRLIAHPWGWRVRVVGWAERYRVPMGLRRRGARLHPVTWPAGPLSGIKSTSYLGYRTALAAARKAGADAALLVEPNGTIRETDHANLFVRIGGEVFTPPAPGRCLPGVLRAWCLEVLPGLGWPAREQDLDLDTISRWDEAWLTSSLAGVVPVEAVADRTLAGSQECFRKLVARGVPAPGGYATR